MTYFVRVPKATIHTCKMGAESSEGEGNCGGQANQQMGPIAPSTPPKKAVRAIPSSPTTSSASAGAVGVKFCQCCFATSKPCLYPNAAQLADSCPLAMLSQYPETVSAYIGCDPYIAAFKAESRRHESA